MSRTIVQRLAAASLGAWLTTAGSSVQAADRNPAAAAIEQPAPMEGHPLPPRRVAGRGVVAPSLASGAWWLGTAGIAVVLALFGGLGLASRRLLPRGASGALEVVGRASLSPKHTVYLLRVGNRVLIVGAGAQGPPALLGELDNPDELQRPAPRADRDPAPAPPRFDLRIGDEP
jgi:flagellar protein FliO/FliZ